MQIQVCTLNRAKVSSSSVTDFIALIVHKQAYLLCKKNMNQIDKTMQLIEDSSYYFCRFSRYTNLNYAFNLGKLLICLGIENTDQIQNQWLALYEIDNYRPQLTRRFIIEDPCYGSSVLLGSVGTYRKKYISNCFKYEGKCYYFVDNERLQRQQRMLAEIISQDKKTIFGINVIIKNINVCLSLRNILEDNVGMFRISPLIKDILAKTVYLNYKGSYSTGTLISNRKILTAKHLVPFSKPRIGASIEVRLYPYNTTLNAKVTQYPAQFIDLMQLQITNQLQPHQDQKQQYFCYISMGFQYLRLGLDVRVIGFGKYNYQECNFHKISLLLPTLSLGFVSKVIPINHKETFFKVYANLYNGFSGGGIWHKEKQIGTAIFILKNPNTKNFYNNHNISYSQKFIWNAFLRPIKWEFSDEQVKNLKRFQAVQTRDQLVIRAKL